MHIATKIGLFYALFSAVEWLLHLSVDRITLAIAAVFCAGMWNDLARINEDQKKREMVRNDPNLSIDPDTGKLVRRNRRD